MSSTAPVAGRAGTQATAPAAGARSPWLYMGVAAAQPHWKRAQLEVNRTLGEATVAGLHDWLDRVTPAFRAEGEAA